MAAFHQRQQREYHANVAKQHEDHITEYLNQQSHADQQAAQNNGNLYQMPGYIISPHGQQPPLHHIATPGDTLDRHRYLAKITNASNKQMQLFKIAQEHRQHEGVAPKERLIMQYMNGPPQPGSLFDQQRLTDNGPPHKGSLSMMTKQGVSQLELQDPAARDGLKQILNVQLQEKRER